MQERTSLEAQIKAITEISSEREDLLGLAEIAADEGDEGTGDEILKMMSALSERASKAETEALLSGEADGNDCYIEIHPGAGGTESNDWAGMLLRMYLRWAQKRGYGTEIIEQQYGEEAGIKSASIKVSGFNAYGWLKTESGVHRLVRISPFDSNARRHTSFASVWVYPVIDDSIEIDVKESDCRIDTFRSSGAGGQHVNTTDSAVRITHIPSGIVVISQLKSQHQNRAQAMLMLRTKLYDAERERQARERAAERKGQVGSGDRSERIRTYNFPQGRVTDHRINLTVYNLPEVIDGSGLDPLLDALAAEDRARKLAALEEE